MTPKEALEVGNKVWTGYRVVTLKENHRIDSTTKWWYIEEDNFEYREDRFEEIPIYVQNLLKALTELEELKRDVKRYFELEGNYQKSSHEYHEMEYIKNKLMEVGKEE